LAVEGDRRDRDGGLVGEASFNVVVGCVPRCEAETVAVGVDDYVDVVVVVEGVGRQDVTPVLACPACGEEVGGREMDFRWLPGRPRTNGSAESPPAPTESASSS